MMFRVFCVFLFGWNEFQAFFLFSDHFKAMFIADKRRHKIIYLNVNSFLFWHANLISGDSKFRIIYGI